jgi:hypothetical protein
MKKLLTLCIVHQGDRVLLGMKKRGFGDGKTVLTYSCNKATVKA